MSTTHGESSQLNGINIYNPGTIGRPLGQYSHVTRVKASELLFIAGMLPVNESGASVGENDFNAQAEQIFRNIGAALKSAGADFSNIVQFTTYLVSPDYIPALMEFRMRRFPDFFPNGAYPPNTLLIIDRLVHPEFLVEVQTIAALP
jgi:enamine deaminase RidA (YjgF/YER057c/UK114 family)